MSKREDDIPRERGAAGNERRIHAWAAAWGLAEGTFFFIVPDVWLSWVALRRARTARKAVLSALAGALVGGALVHGWARRAEADATRAWLLRVPAITPEMIAEVEAGLERGMHTMVLGPLRGIPYKIYARTAGTRGESLGAFLSWSVPARLPRFLLLPAATQAFTTAGRKLLGGAHPRLEQAMHLLAWSAFYTWYFRHTGVFASKRGRRRRR